MASALAALLLAVVSCHAAAQETPCPLPGQKPSLVVQLYLGQSIKNRGPVTHREWDEFLLHTVTPRFPDGFTVHDAYGPWRNPDTRVVVREKTKVIVIVAADTVPVRTDIAEVAEAFRQLFHQQSVAIVTNSACSVF